MKIENLMWTWRGGPTYTQLIYTPWSYIFLFPETFNTDFFELLRLKNTNHVDVLSVDVISFNIFTCQSTQLRNQRCFVTIELDACCYEFSARCFGKSRLFLKRWSITPDYTQ